MTIPPWYRGAEIGKTPTATAISSSCYLIKLNSLYLGTVLTLRRGRIVANSMALTLLSGITIVMVNINYRIASMEGEEVFIPKSCTDSVIFV